MNGMRPNPSLVLSLIALVMASAGTGYAALGDGGDAVTAGNSRGEPVEIQVRNRSRGETGLVTASDGYSLRLSNTQEGGGGGAVYGCRAPDAPPARDLACLYADNLRGGKAFLFRSQQGPTVGHFDLGNPAGAPFSTNATGLVQNLNADKVDGLDASQLQGATGPQGPQGVPGPQGPAGSDAQFDGAAAGGDLTGTYPSPQIADSAVDSAAVADAALRRVDDSIFDTIDFIDPPSIAAGACLTDTLDGGVFEDVEVGDVGYTYPLASLADGLMVQTGIRQSASGSFQYRICNISNAAVNDLTRVYGVRLVR